jgi:hypothetical protein
MQLTYSVTEIKLLVRDIDHDCLYLVQELIEEEKELFSTPELKAVYKFIEVKNRQNVENNVKADFLLSFN